ncbi:MAG: hypothetical protein AAF236_06980 [Verrucomicrobiota bacterium]
MRNRVIQSLVLCHVYLLGIGAAGLLFASSIPKIQATTELDYLLPLRLIKLSTVDERTEMRRRLETQSGIRPFWLYASSSLMAAAGLAGLILLKKVPGQKRE